MYSFKRIKLFSKTRVLLSIVIGIGISVIIGLIVCDKLFRGNDSSTDVKEIEEQIDRVASEFNNEKGNLENFEYFGSRLNFHNKNLAQSKVLAQLIPPVKYQDVFDEFYWKQIFQHHLWSDRFKLSQGSWEMYDLKTVLLKSIGAGTLSNILTIPISWLSLLIVSWVWYFFLDRIRELSNALCGHIEPEDTMLEKPIEIIPENSDTEIIANKLAKEHKKLGTRWLFFWENILLPINILTGIYGLIMLMIMYCSIPNLICTLFMLALTSATIIGLKSRRLWGWRLNFVLLIAVTMSFAFYEYDKKTQQYERYTMAHATLINSGEYPSDSKIMPPPTVDSEEILIRLGIASILFLLPSSIYFARRRNVFVNKKPPEICCPPLESMGFAIK